MAHICYVNNCSEAPTRKFAINQDEFLICDIHDDDVLRIRQELNDHIQKLERIAINKIRNLEKEVKNDVRCKKL